MPVLHVSCPLALDNIITRFLEGYWIHQKYYEPPFEVASLWMDQKHPADVGNRLAKAYGMPVTKTIADALTLGTGKLAVDAVIVVCEHGEYPHNEKQQQLYPRYEFFEQVVQVFKNSGRSCRCSPTSTSPTMEKGEADVRLVA